MIDFLVRLLFWLHIQMTELNEVSRDALMTNLMDHPLILFSLSFLVLSLSAWLGRLLAKKRRGQETVISSSFGVTEAATLTLLGLIIGFTFSLALSLYEQRKNY
jgi:hypothetical protein